MVLGRKFVILILTLFVATQAKTQDIKAIPVTVKVLPLTHSTTPCTGQFTTHQLDHISTVAGGQNVRMFEANGGGVGINDLDNDGDLDIVLANQADMNTILWNEGELIFQTEHMAHGESRAVTIIDLDGDGLMDIIFSRTKGPPTYWHNEGQQRFSREFLAGISKPVYSINWADLDGDNDLDLAGATYDASLLTDFGQEFLTSGNAGVYLYENKGRQFGLHVLSTNSQGLALALLDLNEDHYLDIWVGNDFGVPDQLWYWSASGWQPATPLNSMSYSTMSLDFADINNDGHNEVFSTDMRPMPTADSVGENALQTINDNINADTRAAGDTQITSNVLQSVKGFSNVAESSGVDATGWSWSGKFGDLDQDGLLDLYVVNGFAEMGTFAQLPNHELVEPNQAFRNTGDGDFTPAPEWGLASMEGGRGMSMADLDADGDLDIVVNNLNAPAELFENRICTGQSLQVDLIWPVSMNTRAIGSRLVLYSDQGTYSRDVKALSGYLSGDASRTHFGFPATAQLQRLEIQWPDRTTSVIDSPTTGVLLEVTRTD